MTWFDRILSLCRPVPVPPPPPVSPTDDPDGYRAVVVGLFNRARADHLIADLTADVRCNRAALVQSDFQAACRSQGHAGPGGDTVGDRLRREGYVYSAAAEDVGAGYPDAAAIFAGWMGSPRHRAAILGPYRHVGVAATTGADGLRYWTAVFAMPSQFAGLAMSGPLAAPEGT